jgi:hypothetical protein
MITKIWRLSENSGDDNLGLACTEQGLMLGRTPLIEPRDGRFEVRERGELERLLGRGYRGSCRWIGSCQACPRSSRASTSFGCAPNRRRGWPEQVRL